MTLYVLTSETRLANFTGLDWHTWIECTANDDLFASMVGHRHMRQRGGIGPDETRVKVFVYIRQTMDVPCVVNFTEFNFWPEQEAVTA